MTAVLCRSMTARVVRRVMQALRSGPLRSSAAAATQPLSSSTATQQFTPDKSAVTLHNAISVRQDCTYSSSLLIVAQEKTRRRRPVSQPQRTIQYNFCTSCTTSALNTSTSNDGEEDKNKSCGEEVEVPWYLYFHPSCGGVTREAVVASMVVHEDFISQQEEAAFMKEVEPHLKRIKYEYTHWDDAIHGFREVERSRWSSGCSEVLRRVVARGFPHTQHPPLPQTHVLDLAQEGVIKPHVDSVRFCGNTICGLCLLSDAVMRLVKVDSQDQVVDVLLPRRSLYVMRDVARYDFSHAVLGQEQSWFRGNQVPRGRRVSIISRNHPQHH